MFHIGQVRHGVHTLILAAGLAAANPLPAFASESHQFDVAVVSNTVAIQQFAAQSGVQILVPAKELEGKKLHEVSGRLSTDAALSTLLEGTGLTRRYVGERTIVLVKENSPVSDVNSLDDSRNVRVAQADTVSKGGQQGSAETNSGDAGDGGQLEEIVVTAQKRLQRVIDVPISMTTLSGEELQRRGIQDVMALSHSVPGLAVIDRGPGERQYTIRGIGNQNGSASLVGIYLDELPITSDPLRQLDLSLMDLERVEVLRGPQGTLYGAGSAGGTIRFITRQPDLSAWSGEGAVSGAFTSHGDPAEEITAVLNAPVVSDVFGLRLAARYSNADGWIDQPAAGRRDINDQQVAEARLKALWKPGSSLEVQGLVAVHRADMDWDNQADDHRNLVYALDRTATPPERHDDYELYNLTATYNFGASSLLSSTGYVNSDKYLPFSSIDPSGALEFAGVNVVTSHVFTQELRLSSTGSGEFHWLAGAFYQDLTNRNPLTFDLLLPGIGLIPDIASINVLDSRSVAVFGEASTKVAGKLEIGAGLRYFRDDANDDAGDSRKFHAVSPRVFATYELTQHSRAYTNIGRGFRSGGFNGPGNPQYDPEHTMSFELGLKTELPRQFYTDLAVFRMNYDDVLTFSALSATNPTNITANGGTARITGVDASLEWRSEARLAAGVNGNYTHTRFTDIDPLSRSHVAGDRLDYVPKYNFAAWINQDFQWNESVAGFARIDVSAQGRMSFINRATGLSGESDVVQLLDARIGASFEKWSAELFGSNLLNEDEAQTPFETINSIASRPRPRTIGIRVNARFN